MNVEEIEHCLNQLYILYNIVLYNDCINLKKKKNIEDKFVK